MSVRKILAPLLGGPNDGPTLFAAFAVGEGLERHGLDAGARVVPRAHEAVGHTLLSAAQEIEASLLVMGGYAHNRFEEVVFGGTTLHAMRHTHLPLLMMH